MFKIPCFLDFHTQKQGMVTFRKSYYECQTADETVLIFAQIPKSEIKQDFDMSSNICHILSNLIVTMPTILIL